MAQDRQDLPLHDLHSGFHLGLVPGFFDPRREDHGAVVFGQLLIRAVQLRFVATRMRNRRLGVVGHRGFGHPAKEGIRLHVPRNPSRQLLVREGRDKRLVARAQHGHEHMGFGDGAARRIVDRHRLPGPVHEQLLPGPTHPG